MVSRGSSIGLWIGSYALLPPCSSLLSPTSVLVLDTNLCSRSQPESPSCLYRRQEYYSGVASATPTFLPSQNTLPTGGCLLSNNDFI